MADEDGRITTETQAPRRDTGYHAGITGRDHLAQLSHEENALNERATIELRHAEPGDFEAVRRILASPKVIWGTMQMPYPSAEQWRKRLADPPMGLYNLVASVEGEVVGQLSLSTFPNRPRRRHVGQLGMAVREDWHGRGVGTALVAGAVDLADKWLNLSRLELEVYTDNEFAIRLYEKFGFRTEGTLEAFAFRDGIYVDAFIMGRVLRQGSGQEIV